MKRNNRGFTLIELLAAVVILGILVAISIPLITGLFDSSKRKMYVSDARKLISLAEYRVQASSSIIEKPDEGDCILISMLYLDSSDFDNPPGEGEYLKENSYVVVRNHNGKLEYAATVVEKIKGGGYRGVQLTKNSDLISSSAVSRVLDNDEIDILHVESDVTRGYINEKLGYNYIPVDNSITAIYNQPELDDNSATSNNSNAPRIVYAAMVSTSNKYYNSLDATLQLKVEDKDTPKNQLRVYINVESGYSENVTPKTYKDAFTYDIKFDQYGKKYDGETVKVYVIVKDNNNNTAKKTITYKIHKDEPPNVDDSSGVTRRTRDFYYGSGKNMLEAKITFIASDDLDDNNKLLVCLADSKDDINYDVCPNSYNKYTDVFKDGVIESYRFNNCNGEVCQRDGHVHHLTIFIMDSQGQVTKKKYDYQLSVNKPPTLNLKSLQSNGIACIRGSCPIENGGNKKILITATVTDDVDPYYNTMYLMVHDKHTGQYNAVPFNVTSNNTPVICDLGGLYDGQTRSLEIYLVDSEGLMSTNKYTRDYKLYLNLKPDITGYTISSKGTACINSELCPISTSGGNKIVNVQLAVEDDIDPPTASMTTVCLTTDDNATADTCKPYNYYKNYHNKTVAFSLPNQLYDGSKQNIRVFVKDSEGLTDTAVHNNYLLYTNRDPEIKIATFSSDPKSKPLSGGSLNTVFNIEAVDDVDYPTSLQLQIKEDGVVRQEYDTLSNWMTQVSSTKWSVKDNSYRLYGKHDGQPRTIVVEVMDSDGAKKTKTVNYSVALGQPPTISTNGFTITSNGTPCINDSFCTSGVVNSKVAKVKVSVSDDIDDNANIGIYLTENLNNCSDYSKYNPYTNYLSGSNPKAINYTFNANTTKPYDGSEHTLYLCVKDSDDNVVNQAKTYRLYRNVAPRVGTPTVTTNADNHTTHIPNVTYTIEAEDDLDSGLSIKYCYKKDGGAETCPFGFETYHENKVLDNSFFGATNPNGETYVIYSIVKDSYGVEVKSSDITYKLYTDSVPSIAIGNIANGHNIYKNANGNIIQSLDEVEDPGNYSPYTRLVINFSVDDLYDTYSICISGNDSQCSEYVGTYAGNNCSGGSCSNRVTHAYSYDVPAGVIQNGSLFQLYLFAKDSYGNITHTTLYDGVYNECEELDEINLIYEYEFDANKTQAELGHSNPITMSRCEGKCYYRSNVLSIYRASITNSDIFNSDLVCNANDPTIDDEFYASCDHMDCFYKNNNYVRNAIGTRLYNDSTQWIFTNNGTNYVCTGHYNLYRTDVKNGAVKLNLVGEKICNAALNAGLYNYNANATEPYIRVQD